MEDLENRSPYVPAYSPAWYARNQHPCVKGKIDLEGKYSPGEDTMKALQPFFIEIFDACGEEWSGFRP